jgi:hypothetical protein
MFRKEALRRGALKTINANVGVMVGQPTTYAPTPAVVPGQGVYSRVNTQRFGPPKPTRMQNFMRNPVVRFGKSMFNIPAAGGYIAGDKVGEALGIGELGRVPFGLAGSYAATKALPGLAALPAATSAALMAGPAYLMYAGGKERERIAKMSPKEREAHRRKSMQFGTEGYLTDEMFNQQFKPRPIEEKVEEDKKIIAGKRRSFRTGFENRDKQLKAEGDPLLQDNVANSDDVANLDAVQENSLGIPPEGEDGITNYENTIEENKERREAEKLLTVEEKKKIKKENEAVSTNEIVVGGASNDPDFNKTIALAKKYEEEVYKGEGSQAGLVFLANLASGLLTGTTTRRGLGGAMEVFGQAIGPAVNNYATIKLKEGELRQNRRAKSLEAAMDHMKFLNDAARVERPDVTPGVVQIRGANGDLQNYNGYIGKDGTTYLPGGLGQDGRQSLTPIAQGGVLKDSGPDGKLGTEDDISLGRFEKFLKQDKISSRLSDIEDTLGNRYTAYSVTLDILDTIKKTDAEGNLVSPGVGLTLDTYLRRISNAAADLVGRDIVAENLKVAENTLEGLYEDEVAMINKDPDLSEKEKENAIAMIDKDKLKDQILKDKKGVGWFSGLSAKDQEKLAVQETSLVYALANTFKDQDRLTQRDINAAREIVNLFAIGRGGQDVRDSIEAIAGQLRADIRRQELLYTSSGGLYSTIQDLKQLEGYDSSVADQKVKEAFFTEEEIKNELEKMELK